jgi:hypothetical protein
MIVWLQRTRRILRGEVSRKMVMNLPGLTIVGWQSLFSVIDIE